MSPLFRPPETERRRIDRIEALVAWFNSAFTDSRECFHDLVAKLAHFQNFQINALPRRQLDTLAREGASWNWLALRDELLAQIQRELPVLPAELAFGLWKAKRLLAQEWLKTRVLTAKPISFVQPPQYILGAQAPNGELYYETRVSIFEPGSGTRDRRRRQKAVQRYIRSLLYNDLIGLHVFILLRCHQCKNYFVQRRRIPRKFCSANCRALSAAKKPAGR